MVNSDSIRGTESHQILNRKNEHCDKNEENEYT